MHAALEAVNDMLRILFMNKLDELVDQIEKRIRNYYAKEEQMLISFLIGGCIHLMMKSRNKDEDVEKFLLQVITKIV